MIAFACGVMVVTCIWFGFNVIIVLDAHLVEVMFEFSLNPVVNDNKLRSQVTCQSDSMKQSLDGCLLTYLWLQQFQTILCFVAGSIIMSTSRECVLMI
jgi:hypothetical protein